MSNEELIQQFIEITSAPRDYAIQYLEMYNNDLETAIGGYFENPIIEQYDQNESNSNRNNLNEENEYSNYTQPERVIIEQLQDNHSNTPETLLYRNFKDEAEGKTTKYDQFIPSSESSVLGDFGAACERAEKENKWLIAYVYEDNDHNALSMIRDIWKSASIRWIMSRNFVLWVPYISYGSKYTTSSTALSKIKSYKDYVNVYRTKIPSIALHDPITGELKEKIDPKVTEKELHDKLKEIEKTYGKLREEENNRKYVDEDNIFNISSCDSDDDIVCFGENKPKNKEKEIHSVIEIDETNTHFEIDDNDGDNNNKNDTVVLDNNLVINKKVLQQEINDFCINHTGGFDQLKQSKEYVKTNEMKEKENQKETEIEKIMILEEEDDIQINDNIETNDENNQNEMKEEKKESVHDKPKEGKVGKIKIIDGKETKMIDIYENYTIGDLIELIQNEKSIKEYTIWSNSLKKSIEGFEKDSLLKDLKLYPSAALYLKKK